MNHLTQIRRSFQSMQRAYDLAQKDSRRDKELALAVCQEARAFLERAITALQHELSVNDACVCSSCGRKMSADEIGDELPAERVCDQCAGPS